MLQLRQRASARCLVDELFFQFLDLGAVKIFDVVVQVLIGVVELDAEGFSFDEDGVGSLLGLDLAGLVLEPLTTPRE